MNLQVCGVQTTANEVVVINKNKNVKLNTDLKVIGVTVSEEHIAVWSGKTVAVYQLSDMTALNVIGEFVEFGKAFGFLDRKLESVYVNLKKINYEYFLFF